MLRSNVNPVHCVRKTQAMVKTWRRKAAPVTFFGATVMVT